MSKKKKGEEWKDKRKTEELEKVDSKGLNTPLDNFKPTSSR